MNSIPVKTIEISHGLDLLKHLPEANSLASLAWIRGGDGVIGIGEFERFEVSGGNSSGNDQDRFDQMRAWWQASNGRSECAVKSRAKTTLSNSPAVILATAWETIPSQR